MAAPHEYKIGFVAFIDILGWSELVKNSARDKVCFDRLVGLLDTIRKYADELDLPISQKGVKIAQISDSIFVTVNVAEASQRPERISLYATLIARECFSRGMLTRGGITIGEYYQEGSTLLGPAVERAYRIEQATQQPLIAIDPSPVVISEFLDEDEYGFHIPNLNSEGRPERYTPVSISPIAKTKEGTFFIDWMRRDISNEPRVGPKRVYVEEDEPKLIDTIVNGTHPLAIRPKIDWFRRYSFGSWRNSEEGEFTQINFKNDRDIARWVKSDDYFEKFRYEKLKTDLVPLV